MPGETALITAAILAQNGNLSIELVIAIAAGSAIVGDNVGYLLGRTLGRGVLTRPGRARERRLALLDRGDRFFARHGAKAVFFGRWVAGLRVWASWLAGATSMPWRRFLVWNALGGIAWALTVGLAAYFAGKAAKNVIANVGVGAVIAVAVGAVGGYAWFRWRRRRSRAADASGPATGQPVD